jgi:hypothetical protein
MHLSRNTCIWHCGKVNLEPCPESTLEAGISGDFGTRIGNV